MTQFDIICVGDFMPIALHEKKRLKPGSSGWAVSDLNDPEVSQVWEHNRYEIIYGVIHDMPPAYFNHGESAFELLSITRTYLRSRGVKCRSSTEVDLVVSEDLLLRVDGMLIDQSQTLAQRRVQIEIGETSDELHRIRVAPLLVIESVSLGHESHDRSFKQRVYAEFGIMNYWIVDAHRHTLDVLRLHNNAYTLDASGKERDVVRPGVFPGLELNLAEVFHIEDAGDEDGKN